MSAPGASSPEDLLMQISMLMEQYLAMGEQTPAFDVVSQVLPEIQAAAGGGGMPPEAGGMPPGMPPEAGGMPPMGPEAGLPADPMMGGEMPMPDMTGGIPPGEMEAGSYGSFDEANAALTEDIRKKKTKGR